MGVGGGIYVLSAPPRKGRSGSSPQLFEPCRVRGSVLDGVLNVPVSEKILNEPRVGSLIGEGEAASVAQHVRMGNQGQGSGDAVRLQKEIDR